ncbi:MAG: hypothetical protein O7G88_04830 [bacterium]|nr:hypothetical protein [bacterium]
MPNHQPTGAQVGAVQHALDQQLPSGMLRTWWDGDAMAQMFEFSYDAVVNQVEIGATFFADCPDYATGLYDSELADYIREMPSRGKCFIVRWHEGRVRIRCKLL